jgi:parallel beta-helix repeat protein
MKAVSGMMLTLLLIGMLTLAFNNQLAKAGTIIVPDDYPTIQQAINAASLGDVIFVKAGTYYEHIVVNKSVSIVGESPAATIVDGRWAGNVFEVVADHVLIANFTVQNAGRFNSGILLKGCKNTKILNNNIANNRDGIFLSKSSNNTISRNSIANNEIGIFLYKSSNNNTVSGNRVTQNGRDGILLSGCSNNLVSENKVVNNRIGLILSGSSNNKLYMNNVANNWLGTQLYYSRNNTLIGNIIADNKYNFDVFGEKLSHFLNNVDNSNSVNGKPVYYWVNKRDLEVPIDAGYVAIVNCTRITVRGLNLTNNFQGILLAYTKNSTITDNSITSNWFGIALYHSSNNRIFGNNIANNYFGIRLYNSSNNRIFHNNFVNNNERSSAYQSFANAWDMVIHPAVTIGATTLA